MRLRGVHSGGVRSKGRTTLGLMIRILYQRLTLQHSQILLTRSIQRRRSHYGVHGTMHTELHRHQQPAGQL